MPSSGLDADLRGQGLKSPSHPPAGRRCPFKQQPAGWHAQRVSQRPVPADSPTGSLLLPQPSPHTDN